MVFNGLHKTCDGSVEDVEDNIVTFYIGKAFG